MDAIDSHSLPPQPVSLAATRSHRKRALSCLSDPVAAVDAASPRNKRPRHREAPRILDWLAKISPKRTPQTRSASSLDEEVAAPPFDEVDPSISAMEGAESFYSDSLKSSSGRSTTRHVESSLYRAFHCEANGVYYQEPYEALPEPVHNVISRLNETRQSPQPDFSNDRQLVSIEAAPESAVENYFKEKVFTSFSNVRRDDRLPMSTYQVPSKPGVGKRISRPIPDSLYGYEMGTFRDKLAAIGQSGLANSQQLFYPFLAIEFKGDGPNSSGSLWVATNQCLGAGSTCVTISEKLNKLLRDGREDTQRINTHAFSVALSGSEARLLVSWKAEDERIYTQKFRQFATQDPVQLQQFRTMCRNIIDWGVTERLQSILTAVDTLAYHTEQTRLAHAAQAKSRPPPQNLEPQHPSKHARTSTSASNASYSSHASSSTTTLARSRLVSIPESSDWSFDASRKQYYRVQEGNYVFQDGTTVPVSH